MADENETTTKGALTAYVVLRLGGANGEQDALSDLWKPVATLKARGALQAIKQYAGAEPGTYVAVPARSWQPKTLAVKTETKQVWS